MFVPRLILHFFGAGLGAVVPPVATGAISPSNPPAALVTTPACTFAPAGLPPGEVVWAGLAPGFVGYYQMDVRLLAQTGSASCPAMIVTMNCGTGIAAEFPVEGNAP